MMVLTHTRKDGVLTDKKSVNFLDLFCASSAFWRV